MWWSKQSRARLKIWQQGAALPNVAGRYIWKIHWELDVGPGIPPERRAFTFVEPFTPNQYEEIADYLDSSLDDDEFDENEADASSTQIDGYRTHLFRRLRLCNQLGALKGKSLEVHIWPDERGGAGVRSIHSIQWEQLEDLSLWSHGSLKGPSSVTVCRHVQPRKPKVSLRQRPIKIFDILLVVSRPNIHDAPEEGEGNVLNPATIRNVLLQLQEELVSVNSTQQIRLEVVRPGCFCELENHLKRRSTQTFDIPYHAIHFDMHGGVSENRRAFLEFNRYQNNDHRLHTTTKYADDIAVLLRKNNVKCAILNACKSAVAHEGASANLSSIFIKHDVEAVLAMSHNMHDSISKRFYSEFYRELLIHHEAISVAASKARRKLFKDRKRWHYSREREVDIQDWFIPVVYTSSEEPWRLTRHSRFLWLALYDTMIFAISVLSLFVGAMIYYLELGKRSQTLRKVVTKPSGPSSSILISYAQILLVGPPSVVLARRFWGLREHWRLRQRLKILSEDRKNVLRIEGDLSKKKMIFFHSADDVGDTARPLLESLTYVWKRTCFVDHGVSIDAEWFVHPTDLGPHDGWNLWIKAYKNVLCLRVYNLKNRHFGSSGATKTVIIMDNLDILYPEDSVLNQNQYYALAQRRLEDWLQEHFSSRPNKTLPYLLFTTLRGRALGDKVSDWIKKGPGRSGVLNSPAITKYAETTSRYIDPNNALYDKAKWYDWSMSWLCGDMSRPVKKGLLSALLDLPGSLTEDVM